MPGVTEHTVSRWGVTVTFDPDRISSQEIARTIIRETGYPAGPRRPRG